MAIYSSNKVLWQSPQSILKANNQTINVVESGLTPWSVPKSAIKVNTDLLAVSCHLWRNFKDNWEKRYLSLKEAAKTLNLTQIDYYNAELVADYFSKHILIKQLKGDLTDFQKSVLTFITSDRMSYDSDKPGLIYRLPEYYETDQLLIKMKDAYYNHDYVSINSNFSRYMKPILKVKRNTVQLKVDQYWLIDIETNNLVMIDVDSKNQIKYIWDHMFDTSESIKIKAIWENKSHSLNFNYMSSDEWMIDFNKDIA
jgi:hypothetical protein